MQIKTIIAFKQKDGAGIICNLAHCIFFLFPDYKLFSDIIHSEQNMYVYHLHAEYRKTGQSQNIYKDSKL